MQEKSVILLIFILSIFLSLVGLSYFEDARVSRCAAKLYDPRLDESLKKSWRDLDRLQEKSIRNNSFFNIGNLEIEIKKDQEKAIQEQKLEDAAQARFQKKLEKYLKAEEACLSRITPSSWIGLFVDWGNFLIDLSL